MKQNLLKSITIILLFFVGLNPLFSQVNPNPAGAKSVSIEDWETGDFSQYEWEFGGNANWTISSQNPHEGMYSAQSGLINHNQTSSLILNYEVYSADTLSFWLRVSSENNYDYLRFYVDGNEQDSWAGTVAWQQAIYVISPGTHTFKWEYDKDGSVSTGSDACWIDYIVFPPMEIEALFVADTTVICIDEEINFYDQSVGPITEWKWTFEGGTPAISTDQNPVVTYSEAGVWDVTLEVTDGIEGDTLLVEGFMMVGDVPNAAPTPSGSSLLCASWGNSSYSTSGLSGISQYSWTIDPPEAGTLSGTGTSVTVAWEQDFLGLADLMVAGINYCGIGAYSMPFTINRYLPDVSVMLPAFVALSTPPFELTGGLPLGGEYTGPGVSNGIFDPAAAGMGMHTITYTYTDVNFCSNFAIDSIGVTEFTGIINQADLGAVNVFPNPNNGNFKVKFNLEQNDIINLKVYNALNAVVFEENNISVRQTFSKEITLENLNKGVYYLHIDGKQTNIIKKLVIQ